MGGRKKVTADELADAMTALKAATAARRRATLGTKAYEEALALEERASKRVVDLAQRWPGANSGSG